jgi:hypothetical protein
MPKMRIEITAAYVDEGRFEPDFPIVKEFDWEFTVSLYELAQSMNPLWAKMHGETPSRLEFSATKVSE